MAAPPRSDPGADGGSVGDGGGMMDGGGQHTATGAPSEPRLPVPSTVEALTAHFARLVAETEEAAHDFGIRWREPEGRFVHTLLAAMQLLNAVGNRAEAAFAAAARDARIVAEAELQKVREVALAIEGAKHQARAAIDVSRVEHQVELRKIVADTMPGVIAEMQQFVVIREQSWNRERARASIRTAGLWMLGVFLAGFALCLWMEWSDSTVGARCRSNLVSVEGRTYCLVSAAASQAPGTNDKEQAKP